MTRRIRELVDRLSRHCLPRNAEGGDATFCGDGLTRAQRWARYLVCRSRSPRLVEWSGTDPGHLAVWSCAWPEGRDGSSTPDARPARTHCQRSAIGRSGLARALDAVADTSSVLLLSHMDEDRMVAWNLEPIRRVVDRSRYTVLASGRAGSRDIGDTSRFAVWIRDLGIPDTLCSVTAEAEGAIACALGGYETRPPGERPAPARVLALMTVYNEADIIAESAAALLGQGLDLFVIDDGSTDGTVEILESLAATTGRVTVARSAGPGRNAYDKGALLHQQAEQARRACAAGYTWMMLVDADEIRQSPWPDIPLAQAFARVEELGYNAVDFSVLDFRFLTDDVPVHRAFESHLRCFEFGSRPGHFVQIKAWRHTAEREVEAHLSGGHDVRFAGRRVFPLKFLIKHYPLRNPSQAHRKIFRDRLPRYMPESIAEGRHMHYNQYKDRPPLGWPREALHEWDATFHSRYLIERLSGLGLPGHMWG